MLRYITAGGVDNGDAVQGEPVPHSLRSGARPRKRHQDHAHSPCDPRGPRPAAASCGGNLPLLQSAARPNDVRLERSRRLESLEALVNALSFM